MAMQKRTDSTRALRRQAELAVDMFLDVLLSDNDAVARESRSLIGALVEFKGQIPKSSGNSEVCTLAAKVDRMQRFSDLHLMACVLLRNLSDRQRDALVFDRFYRNRTKVAVDPFSERRVGIYWDDAACAQALHCTVSTFRQRVYDGYQRLETALSDTAPFTKAA